MVFQGYDNIEKKLGAVLYVCPNFPNELVLSTNVKNILRAHNVGCGNLYNSQNLGSSFLSKNRVVLIGDIDRKQKKILDKQLAYELLESEFGYDFYLDGELSQTQSSVRFRNLYLELDGAKNQFNVKFNLFFLDNFFNLIRENNLKMSLNESETSVTFYGFEELFQFYPERRESLENSIDFYKNLFDLEFVDLNK